MNLLKYGLNPWKNPDYLIRLDFARRSKNEKNLLFLALNDVHESVRLAAVKSLRKDTARLQVIQFSSCERSSEMAVRFLMSDDARGEAARQCDLSAALRLEALQAMQKSDEVILDLISDSVDVIALYAIERCHSPSALEAAYSEVLCDERCLAILRKIEDEELALQVYEGSRVNQRRALALDKIKAPALLKDLFFREHDRELRAKIIDRCDCDIILKEFFNDEDDEPLRAKITGKIKDSKWLIVRATEDYNLDIRRSATEALKDPELLVEVARVNIDFRVNEIIIQKKLDDTALFEMAMSAASSMARVEAVQQIKDCATLDRLYTEAKHADTLWFAGRRLGHLPINYLREIKSSETLVYAARMDSHKLVRGAAIRQISEEWAMKKLAASEDTELAQIAASLLKEVTIPAGVRFLDIPDRNYQLSVFPITGDQFALWKAALGQHEQAEAYAVLKDMPVVDVSIQDARAYCDWLSSSDHAHYRLPYFHEWRHAAVADSVDWFSTGNMRAFASAEQADMVLFGQEQRARPMHEAVPNPWGLLDIIGNVMEWMNDVPISSQMLSAAVPMDELARYGAELGVLAAPTDYAHASGNHWADRRIRIGRWKRLVYFKNLKLAAAGKVGFRVLRVDNGTGKVPIEYQLKLRPEVAIGYTQEQVCGELSRALQIDFEDICRRYSVTPSRIVVTRDYAKLLRSKQGWENCGALTELTARPLDLRQSDG